MKKNLIAQALFPLCFLTVQTANAQTPYESMQTLPGIIEMEYYDKGGEGVAYHDEEEENQGKVFRTDEGVDLDVLENGSYVLGWTMKGEWLTYTVDVQETDQYKISATVASGLDGSAFRLYIDNKEVTGDITVPNTGSWTNFTNISATTSEITKGTHTLKFYVVNSYCNIDKILFMAKSKKVTYEFTAPTSENDVCADTKYTVKWESSDFSDELFNLNWVNDKGEVTILKSKVAATDSYEAIVPENYEGQSGYYTLSQIEGGLIPSDLDGQKHTVSNPIIWADVPDVSVTRVGDTYYMASTTMHMNPGVPIMASKDLARWRTINYAHQALDNGDNLNMNNGKNAYGKGSWASSIKYKDGTWYVLTPSYTTNRTHIFKTDDIIKGPWKSATLPFYHDPSLLLDDDGRVYVLYGSGNINIIELSADAMSVKSGATSRRILSSPASIAGSSFYVECEGTQVMKKNGYYYIFLISWPAGKCRSVLCYRSKSLNGSFEGKVLLQDNGVAQGGIFDTPNGDWYGMFFRDNGSVGRIPYLVPVSWSNDWPVLGNNGKVPSSLQLGAVQEEGFGMVTSDEFDKEELPLEWQWNHNPVAKNWGWNNGSMRLTNGRIDADVVSTQNTLTQRTFGPNCSGWTKLNTAGLKDGDCAGLVALQDKYGFVGVKVNGNSKSIVMRNKTGEVASVPLSQNEVWLRIDMNYTNQTDKATFYYSLNGQSWNSIGTTLSMSYELTHFMGYRYGLFNFGTKNTGGYADFDFFRIGKSINNPIYLKKSGEEKIFAKSVTVTIQKKSTTNTSDINQAECSVAPNPASEYIKVDGIEVSLLELMNLNGVTIATSENEELDLPSHLSGSFLLRITSKDGETMVKKVIVK